MKRVTVTEYRDIPLEHLFIRKAQVRLSEVGKDLDELADSIGAVGLLEPILVAPSDDGRFEIVLGQRRFLAHQQLSLPTIKAGILSERISEIEAKVLSVTENLVRRELTRKDLIDVCTFLYHKYGTIKEVASETGLSADKVSDYVKYDRLKPVLKGLVDGGKVDMKVALRAQDALSLCGDPAPEALEKAALGMSGLSGAMQSKLKQELQRDPGGSVDDAIVRVKTAEKLVSVHVTLGPHEHAALRKFAQDEGTSVEDAALTLLSEALNVKGYASGDEE